MVGVGVGVEVGVGCWSWGLAEQCVKICPRIVPQLSTGLDQHLHALQETV